MGFADKAPYLYIYIKRGHLVDEAASRLYVGYTTSDYSSERISKILIAAVAIGVPGPKIAAAPSR